MALTRLVERGRSQHGSRASIDLSPSGEAMRVEVRKWRNLDELARPWSGAWIGVFDAAVRAAIAPRYAVMSARCGCEDFANCKRGLWIRPANLRDSVAELREQLRALGLHPAALVVGLNDLDDDSRAKATGLWDTAAMLATYRALAENCSRAGPSSSGCALDTAAAESMVLGRDVIRHINLDPVLPEELMPQRALKNLIRTMSGIRSAGAADLAPVHAGAFAARVISQESERPRSCGVIAAPSPTGRDAAGLLSRKIRRLSRN